MAYGRNIEKLITCPDFFRDWRRGGYGYWDLKYSGNMVEIRLKYGLWPKYGKMIFVDNLSRFFGIGY